jgi:hypothetical protein
VPPPAPARHQGARQWELLGYENSAEVYEGAASYYFAWLDCTGALMPTSCFNSKWTTSYN